MNLEALNTLVRNIADQTDGIERYFYGELRDQDVADNATYPALIQLITPLDIIGPLSQERNHFQLSISIIQPIIEDPDEDNWTPVYELTSVLCEKVYMKLRQAGVSPYDFTLSNGTLQPILHWENTSGIVGWQMNLTVEDGQQIDCEPFSGSELCFAISEATWAAIKACMGAAQIAAATDDLCSGGGNVTLEVNGTEFTIIEAPATYDLPVIQDGSPVGSKVGTDWVIPSCPDTTISLPQALSTTNQDAGETLVFTVKDAAEAAFANSLVSVIVVGQDYAVLLADSRLMLNGSTAGTYSRRLNPAVNLQDPNANTVAGTLISQVDNIFTFELAWVNLQINDSGGVIMNQNYINGNSVKIDIRDSNGDLVDASIVDGDVRVTDLPCEELEVTIGADDTAPTVGEEITVTITATGADSFCIWLGNGDSRSGNSASADYTYYLPGIYTLKGLAGIEATGVGGTVKPADQVDVTVDGILDTYGNAAVACSPFLLFRQYAGDYIQVQRDSDSTNDDTPYVAAVADEDSITTFVGANNGGVRQYHSQAGGITLEQTTFADMPVIVDSGTLLKDAFGIPTMRFNGSSTRMTAANPAFWGADRTKLALGFVARCTNTDSATNPLIAQYLAAGDERGYVAFFNGVDSRVAARWSNNGTALQTVYFDDSINEMGFYFAQIDTTESGNNRARVWKTTSLGTTELPVNAGASSGDVSGNIHPSTGDLEFGSFNGGSALFEGECGGFVIDPRLYTSGERTAIQNYMQGIFNNYPS